MRVIFTISLKFLASFWSVGYEKRELETILELSNLIWWLQNRFANVPPSMNCVAFGVTHEIASAKLSRFGPGVKKNETIFFTDTNYFAAQLDPDAAVGRGSTQASVWKVQIFEQPGKP
jgi:hypothetical protein